jgi:hypothetical protein
MKAIEINCNPDRRVLRQFGFIALIIFGILGALVLWHGRLFGLALGAWGRPAAAVLWGLGLVSGVLSLIRPEGNRLLYVALSAITYPIGVAMSYVLMGLIFYGLLTPVNLVFRLIGRDALSRSFEPEAESYWIRRTGVPPVARYFRQF